MFLKLNSVVFYFLNFKNNSIKMKPPTQPPNSFLSFSKDLPAELKHFIKQRQKKTTVILRVTASETRQVQF